ncbi:MAG: hypothetical protein JO235_02440 [Chroococcidiopsidaceae cyanobacterium CP_BM_RX_35]|nr:hypothetical protein [Chroococcidiopsidaceae cyanobacterium CP_BM_RX_35]
MLIQTQSLSTEIVATALEDPLINSSAEQTITILVWALIFALAVVVGLFNRRLEYAIILALVSSIITIAFFVIS